MQGAIQAYDAAHRAIDVVERGPNLQMAHQKPRVAIQDCLRQGVPHESNIDAWRLESRTHGECVADDCVPAVVEMSHRLRAIGGEDVSRWLASNWRRKRLPGSVHSSLQRLLVPLGDQRTERCNAN